MPRYPIFIMLFFVHVMYFQDSAGKKADSAPTETETSVSSFACNLCGKVLKSDANLKKHVEKVHPTLNPQNARSGRRRSLSSHKARSSARKN